MHELYVADPVQKILTVHMRRTVLYPKYDSMGPGCQNYRLDTAIPNNNYVRPKTTGECGMF